MTTSFRVVAVSVGKRAPLLVDGKPTTSAIDKRPVVGPVTVGPRGIEGDEVGHPEHHGHPDQALLLCSTASQAAAGARLGLEVAPGGFGENLTVDGPGEADVRVGDVLTWGGVELEVTAPRAPCSLLAAHLRRPDAVAVVATPHRAGWYARVRRPGVASASDPLVLVARGDPGHTVERVAAVRADDADVAGARDVLRAAALGPRWRARFQARVDAADGRARG